METELKPWERLSTVRDMSNERTPIYKAITRPRRWETPEQVLEEAKDYFDQDPETFRPTIAGLCLHLGVTTTTFYDYESGKRGDEFTGVFKTIRQALESTVEAVLLYGKNQTGAIFWLKNHAGYRDQQTVDHTSGGKPIMVQMTEADERLA